jgi:hypothetical protein
MGQSLILLALPRSESLVVSASSNVEEERVVLLVGGRVKESGGAPTGKVFVLHHTSVDDVSITNSRPRVS